MGHRRAAGFEKNIKNYFSNRAFLSLGVGLATIYGLFFFINNARAEILLFNNEDTGSFYTNTGSDTYFNYFTNIEASTTIENVGLYLRWVATSSDVDIRIGIATGYDSNTNTYSWLEYCDYALTNTEWELIDCPVNQVINGDLLIAVEYGDNQGDFEIMLSPDKYGASVSHYLNGVQANYDEYAFVIDGTLYDEPIPPTPPTATNTLALMSDQFINEGLVFQKLLYSLMIPVIIVIMIAFSIAYLLYSLIKKTFNQL